MLRTSATLAIGLSLCAQLTACSAVQASEQITVEVLAEQIEQGSAPLILDVRSPKEYAAGHIPGAVNIYFQDISNQINTLRALNSDDIIVYCERGVRAGVAESALTEAGFTSVIQLTGNMPAWRDANFAIATSD